jgi:hypothetical protein
MPSYSRKIQIPGKTAKELYNAISKAIDERAHKMPLLGAIKINRDPAKLEIGASASMFSAHLFCEEGGISIEGRMSLLALPMRPKIDGEIDRWVAEAFGSQTV